MVKVRREKGVKGGGRRGGRGKGEKREMGEEGVKRSSFGRLRSG